MTGWRPEAFADEAAFRVFANAARATLPALDMNHDVEWIAAAHGWPHNALLVLADWDEGKVAGLASFIVSNAPLIYALGGFEFFKRKVRQFKLYQGVTSVHGDGERSIGACFTQLAAAMPNSGVVFAGAVPIESELHRQLVDPSSALRRHFHVLAWGKESQHCRIRWEGSVDKYLASIGKKSGKELQRNSKLLLSDPALKCEITCFRTPGEVEVFLRDSIRISDKTYQKKDLGLGISLGGAVERTIRFAVARGGFLGYILYINGEPAAFRYGFVCGRTATMKQTGYDPVWAERQIGSVLFFQVLRDFERMKLAVDCLDFMPDINLFKLRTTNDRRQIRHYYLFKRTFIGTVQYATLTATDFLSRSLGALAKRVRPSAPSELEKYINRLAADAPAK